MTIENAIEQLRACAKDPHQDEENYHVLFDEIVEKQLEEVDPAFMKALHDEYQLSGFARWYA